MEWILAFRVQKAFQRHARGWRGRQTWERNGDLHLQALCILVWGQGGPNSRARTRQRRKDYHSLYPRTCSPRIYMSCGSGGFVCLFVYLFVWLVSGCLSSGIALIVESLGLPSPPLWMHYLLGQKMESSNLRRQERVKEMMQALVV